MSCLWKCLSLLCSAFLQSSASSSSDKYVSLRCDETVEVEAGENVTLNCSIHYQYMSPSDRDGCSVLKVTWKNTSGNIPCDSGSRKYICEWDQKNYVSLTISNVTTEENYTVVVLTDCGMAKSSPINVQVKDTSISSETAGTQLESATKPLVIGTICSISIILVVGIFYVLFETNCGRRIINTSWGTKTQGNNKYTDLLKSKESLIVFNH